MSRPKTLPELAEHFRMHAEGARMASGVSTIRKGSCKYNSLIATATTWATAERLLRETMAAMQSGQV